MPVTKTELVEEKKTFLRRLLPKVSTVYTYNVRGSSYALFCVDTSNSLIANITLPAILVCGRKMPTGNPLFRMTGSGYNHARAIVEELSDALHDDPEALRWESL